jgi:hypothetical protein
VKDIVKTIISVAEMPNIEIASSLQSIVTRLIDSQYKIEDSI